MELKDKVAVVTGAAQGIGKTIALKLAANGCNVVVSDLNIEKLNETKKEISDLGRESLAIKANVAVCAEADAMIEEGVKRLGIVQYAAIMPDSWQTSTETNNRYDCF